MLASLDTFEAVPRSWNLQAEKVVDGSAFDENSCGVGRRENNAGFSGSPLHVGNDGSEQEAFARACTARYEQAAACQCHLLQAHLIR